jgi:RHS repeat-associated protein
MTHFLLTPPALRRVALGMVVAAGATGLRAIAADAAGQTPGQRASADGGAPRSITSLRGGRVGATARGGCPTFVNIVYPTASDTLDATPSASTQDSLVVEYGFVQSGGMNSCLTFELPEDPLSVRQGRSDITSSFTITEISGTPGPYYRARGTVTLPNFANTFTAEFRTLDTSGNPDTLTASRTRYVKPLYALTAGALGTNPDTADSDGQTLLGFQVTNTGRRTVGMVFSCSASGALTCDGTTPSGVSLVVGAATTVQAYAKSASAGLGTVTLVAQQSPTTGIAYPAQASDTAQLRVPTTPLSLAMTAGQRQQRAGCPIVGAGAGSALQCGDLVYAHALPGYRTRNVLRSVTLLYGSQTARPVPVVGIDLTTYPGDRADRFRVVIEREATTDTLAERWFDAAGADSSLLRVRRMIVPIDAVARGLGTGIHPVTVTVQRYAGGVQQATLTGSTNVLVVDRRLSPFGAGWTVAGVERLYPGQPGSRVLHVDANGSATVFTSTGGGTYAAPPGEYSTLATSGTGWVRTLPGTRVKVWYGSTGLPDSVTDNNPTRNRARYFWTALTSGEAALDSIEDSRGKRLAFVRDGAGRVVTIRTPGVADVALRQRAVSGGRAVLDTIVDPDGLPITFGYDTATARMTASRARLSGQFAYAYDGTGRVASVTPPALSNPAPVRTVQSWQGVGAPSSAYPGTSSSAPARAALSDTVVHRVSWPRVYPVELGGVMTTATAIDTVQFRVDGSWAPTLVTLPTGDATAIQRDSAGQPVLVRTLSGAEVRQAYDARGQLLRSVQVVRGRWTDRNMVRYDTTRYEYHPTWESVTRIVPPDTLEAVTIGYDSLGRRASVTDAAGHVTRFTFAADGQLATISEPDPTLGGDNQEPTPTVFQYDSVSGNLWKAGKGTRLTTYVYDTQHRSDLLQVVAPDGQTTTVTYDALKRPTASTGGPADVSTVYEDTAFRRKLVDGNGAVTTFTFDALGRPVSECRPGNVCRTTTYGDGINVTGTSRPGPTGVVNTTIEHDARGLPVKQLVYGDSVTFTYDEFGRRTGASNRISRLEWKHDAYGRMTCEREALRYANDTVSVRWGSVVAWHDYDRAGRRERTYVGSGQGTDPRPCEGIYDYGPVEDQGEVDFNPLEPATWPAPAPMPPGASTYVPAADTVRYTYDRRGNLARLFHRPWAYGQAGTPEWVWQHDAKSRVTQLTHPTASPAAANIAVVNRYSAMDDLTYHGGGQVSDSLIPDAAGRVKLWLGGLDRHYVYDQRARLDSEYVNGVPTRHNQYDAIGNITEDRDWSYAYETNTGIASYGRLLAREKSGLEVRYGYDQAGNTVRTGSTGWVERTSSVMAGGDTEMEYDRWGRMVVQRTAVEDSGCPSSAPLHTEERRFGYDALGRRVSLFSRHPCAQGDVGYWRYWWLDEHVQVKQWNPLHAGSGADSSRVDEDWPAVPGANGTTANAGHWYVYGPGMDQVLGMHNPATYVGPGLLGGTSFVFLRDHRGSVVRTYCTPNTSTGSCGPGIGVNGVGRDYTAYGAADASVKNTPGYNGLESSGGLVYMRNRWYDPNSGRFTQEDPIGYAGGINLYAYAGNDPVTFSDPFGLKVCFAGSQFARDSLAQHTKDATDTEFSVGKDGCIENGSVTARGAELSSAGELLQDYANSSSKDINMFFGSGGSKMVSYDRSTGSAGIRIDKNDIGSPGVYRYLAYKRGSGCYGTEASSPGSVVAHELGHVADRQRGLTLMLGPWAFESAVHLRQGRNVRCGH